MGSEIRVGSEDRQYGIGSEIVQCNMSKFPKNVGDLLMVDAAKSASHKGFAAVAWLGRTALDRDVLCELY